MVFFTIILYTFIGQSALVFSSTRIHFQFSNKVKERMFFWWKFHQYQEDPCLIDHTDTHPQTHTQTLFSGYSVSFLDKETEVQIGEIICLEVYSKLVARR